jgi:hypothetical protein
MELEEALQSLFDQAAAQRIAYVMLAGAMEDRFGGLSDPLADALDDLELGRDTPEQVEWRRTIAEMLRAINDPDPARPQFGAIEGGKSDD